MYLYGNKSDREEKRMSFAIGVQGVTLPALANSSQLSY